MNIKRIGATLGLGIALSVAALAAPGITNASASCVVSNASESVATSSVFKSYAGVEPNTPFDYFFNQYPNSVHDVKGGIYYDVQVTISGCSGQSWVLTWHQQLKGGDGTWNTEQTGISNPNVNMCADTIGAAPCTGSGNFTQGQSGSGNGTFSLNASTRLPNLNGNVLASVCGNPGNNVANDRRIQVNLSAGGTFQSGTAGSALTPFCPGSAGSNW